MEGPSRAAELERELAAAHARQARAEAKLKKLREHLALLKEKAVNSLALVAEQAALQQQLEEATAATSRLQRERDEAARRADDAAAREGAAAAELRRLQRQLDGVQARLARLEQGPVEVEVDEAFLVQLGARLRLQQEWEPQRGPGSPGGDSKRAGAAATAAAAAAAPPAAAELRRMQQEVEDNVVRRVLAVLKRRQPCALPAAAAPSAPGRGLSPAPVPTPRTSANSGALLARGAAASGARQLRRHSAAAQRRSSASAAASAERAWSPAVLQPVQACSSGLFGTTELEVGGSSSSGGGGSPADWPFLQAQGASPCCSTALSPAPALAAKQQRDISSRGSLPQRQQQQQQLAAAAGPVGHKRRRDQAAPQPPQQRLWKSAAGHQPPSPAPAGAVDSAAQLLRATWEGREPAVSAAASLSCSAAVAGSSADDLLMAFCSCFKQSAAPELDLGWLQRQLARTPGAQEPGSGAAALLSVDSWAAAPQASAGLQRLAECAAALEVQQQKQQQQGRGGGQAPGTPWSATCPALSPGVFGGRCHCGGGAACGAERPAHPASELSGSGALCRFGERLTCRLMAPVYCALAAEGSTQQQQQREAAGGLHTQPPTLPQACVATAAAAHVLKALGQQRGFLGLLARLLWLTGRSQRQLSATPMQCPAPADGQVGQLGLACLLAAAGAWPDALAFPAALSARLAPPPLPPPAGQSGGGSSGADQPQAADWTCVCVLDPCRHAIRCCLAEAASAAAIQQQQQQQQKQQQQQQLQGWQPPESGSRPLAEALQQVLRLAPWAMGAGADAAGPAIAAVAQPAPPPQELLEHQLGMVGALVQRRHRLQLQGGGDASRGRGPGAAACDAPLRALGSAATLVSAFVPQCVLGRLLPQVERVLAEAAPPGSASGAAMRELAELASSGFAL